MALFTHFTLSLLSMAIRLLSSGLTWCINPGLQWSQSYCNILSSLFIFWQADIEFPVLEARSDYEEIYMYLKNQMIPFMGSKRCFCLLKPLWDSCGHLGCSEMHLFALLRDTPYGCTFFLPFMLDMIMWLALAHEMWAKVTCYFPDEALGVTIGFTLSLLPTLMETHFDMEPAPSDPWGGLMERYPDPDWICGVSKT